MGFQSTQPENIRQYAKGDYIGGEYKVEDVFGGWGNRVWGWCTWCLLEIICSHLC